MPPALTKKPSVKSNVVAAKNVTLSNSNPLPKEKLLAMYREMMTIRRFEEKAGQLYGMGLIGGFCHLYIGQEAVVTGITAASPPSRLSAVSSPRDSNTPVQTNSPAIIIPWLSI